MSNKPLSPRQKLNLRLDKLPPKSLMELFIVTGKNGDIVSFGFRLPINKLETIIELDVTEEKPI